MYICMTNLGKLVRITKLFIEKMQLLVKKPYLTAIFAVLFF